MDGADGLRESLAGAGGEVVLVSLKVESGLGVGLSSLLSSSFSVNGGEGGFASAFRLSSSVADAGFFAPKLNLIFSPSFRCRNLASSS